MNTALPNLQRGVTFGGMIVIVILLVVVSIFGLKLIPAYIQNAEIKNIFTTIANDPDMQQASVNDIRASFDRRSSIDNINAINAKDIEINVEQGKLTLSASYFVKITVAGNISLYLDFNPTSAK